MATNKNALIRYKVLDKCFRNPGKKYFIDDLIEECEKVLMDIDPDSNGISRRQIFDDISFMESKEGWSIELKKLRDGKKVYYRYEDMSFSINNMPLNEVEINQLKASINILSHFKGMPQFEWMEEMQIRLESIFNFENKPNAIVGFEQNQYLKGIDHFTELFQAIQYKKVLSIQYKSYKQTNSFLFNVHPYYLKQYNSRWFLFGYNEEYNNISNLALDRIISIKTIEKKYQENTTINFETYFDDVIGVTVSNHATVNKIQLEISHSLWPYIESKPIHGSQKIISKNSDNVIIELLLQINYELVSTIFAYGEGIKVLQPESLKKEIIAKAEALIKNYL